MRKAVYPGSFDPVTNGHLDIIARSTELFDSVIVAVLDNDGKAPLFAVSERVEILRDCVRDFPSVEVKSFSGLLVNFLDAVEAKVVLRGIRAIADYEYELQMAMMNRELAPDTETIFMLPAVEYTFVSSRLVKEVCRLGGDISRLVPPLVHTRLVEKFSVHQPT